MPELKTAASLDLVRQLLRRVVSDVAEIEPLVGGEYSAAFAARSSAGPVVLRVNKNQGYDGDVYAQRFASPQLPVPAVLATGLDDGLHWCVSERCPGTILWPLEGEAARAMAEPLCDVLDALAAIDVSGTSGYGLAGTDGEAPYDSWRAYTRESLLRPVATAGLDEHDLRLTSRDQAFLARCAAITAANEAALREDRTLLMGDFNAANILHEGPRITGLVDWSPRYGDQLWEVAGFDLFRPDFGLAETYLARHPGLPAARERLAYYCARYADFVVRFFTYTEQTDKKQYCLDRWEAADWLL